MQTFLIHWKLHWFKYLIGILLILASAFYLFVYKGEAGAVYTFQRYIGLGPRIVSGTKVSVPLDYPQGIVIDQQGNKYYSSGCCVIHKLDANDNYLFSFGGYGTSSDRFGYIERLAVDQQGNVYATDNLWDGSQGFPSVKKFDSNGNFIMEIDNGYGTADGQLQYVDGVAIEPSTGNIYISDCYRHDIQVFSPSGTFITKFGSSGSGDGQLSCPYGITFDHNGDIYIADYSNHRIQKFASSTHTFISKFGTPGSGDGQFNYPLNLVLDSNNDLWVNDAFNRRIQKFSSSTNAFIFKFGSNGMADGQIDNSYGDIAIDPQDNIYIAEQSNNYTINSRISKFDKDGNFIKKYESRGSGDGEFNWSIGIAIDSNRNIYIADDRNQRIQKFDSNGNFLLKFGTPGSGDGQFVNNNSINDLATDAEGNVYVADLGSDRIQKFDSNGNFLLKFGTPGSGDGQLAAPGGIVVHNSTGNVYVTEANNHRVSVFDSNGNFLFKFGSDGTGDGQFKHVTGITITPQNYVYTFDGIDYYNYRLQKFDINGNFILSHTYTYGPGQGQLIPYLRLAYIDSDAQGNIYIADWYKQRIVKLDGSGNYVSSIDTSSKDISPLGIAIDSSGTFYVTSFMSNRAAIFSVTPLLISSTSTSATASSATITWTTSVEGSSQIEFGPSTSYGSSTAETDTGTRVLNHSVTISNLPSCTTFQYRIKSANDSNVYTTSPNYSFTTLGCTGMAEVLETTEVKASSTAISTISLEKITLAIPPEIAASSTNEIVFQAAKLEPTVFFEEAKTPEGKVAIGASVFNLVAIDTVTTDKVSTFQAPIAVSISYSPEDLNGIDPNTLTIYRYDGSTWYALSNCSTDTNTNTVTCYTTHFSDFALFAVPKAPGGAAYYYQRGDIDSPSTIQRVEALRASASNTVSINANPVSAAINSLNKTSLLLSTTLYYGLFSTEVSLLQSYLATLPGIYPEALVTGYYGKLTQKAVQRYQCKYNIICQGSPRETGWGVVGPRTKEVISQ